MWGSVLALLLAQPVAPEPVVWANSGGRPWVLCMQHERQAHEQLLQLFGSRDRADTVWPRRVHECPNAVAVLVMAAAAELQKIALEAPTPGAEHVKKLSLQQSQARQRVQGWLAQASAELERRGSEPPPLFYYLHAVAALGLGQLEAAGAALQRSRERGEIADWRADRAEAIHALLAGDLANALRLAYRTSSLAPGSQQLSSSTVLALVLDRSGAPEAAQRELSRLRIGTPLSQQGLIDVWPLLPVHERLYMMALEQQVRENIGAAQRYWEAYLACPEPDPPERHLVEMRLRELRARGFVIPLAADDGD